MPMSQQNCLPTELKRNSIPNQEGKLDIRKTSYGEEIRETGCLQIGCYTLNL